MSFETAWPLRLGWNRSELWPNGGGRRREWASHKPPGEKCASHFPDFFFLPQQLWFCWANWGNGSFSHFKKNSDPFAPLVVPNEEHWAHRRLWELLTLLKTWVIEREVTLQFHTLQLDYLPFCFCGVHWAFPWTHILSFCPMYCLSFLPPFLFLPLTPTKCCRNACQCLLLQSTLGAPRMGGCWYGATPQACLLHSPSTSGRTTMSAVLSVTARLLSYLWPLEGPC